MAINTPEGCRLEALRLVDMSNDAADRGLPRKARDHYERARELLVMAKKLEADMSRKLEADEAKITVQ